MDMLPASSITKKDRILYLDVLRGLAILFIFLANIPVFSGWYFMSDVQRAALSTEKWDNILDMIIYALVDAKFYSIFSLLFGIGVMVQYDKMKKSGRPFRPFISRRMLILVFLGGLHLFLFWFGDILTLYALLGLLLSACVNWSDRRLLTGVVVLLLLPIVNWWFMHLTGNFYPFRFFGLFQEYILSFDGTSFESSPAGFNSFYLDNYLKIEDLGTFFTINLGFPLVRLGDLLYDGRFFKVSAMFLLGIWAGRKILYNQLLERTQLLKKIVLVGLLIGIPMNIGRTLIEFGYLNGDFAFMMPIFHALGITPLACAYSAIVALILLHYSRYLKGLAVIGKTALTNYVFQTLISIFIFYGLGLGYSGQFGFVQLVIIVIAIFIWQILFSSLWLMYFKMGPLEWIWRMLTYGKWIDIRQKESH